MKKTAVRRTAGAMMIGLSGFALAACGADAPSESELQGHLTKIYVDSGLIPEEQAAKVAECMAPKMVDQLDEDTLESVMELEGEDLKNEGGDQIPQDEMDKVTSIATECATAAA